MKEEKKIVSFLLVRVRLHLEFQTNVSFSQSVFSLHWNGLHLFHIDFIVIMPYCIRIHLRSAMALAKITAFAIS